MSRSYSACESSISVMDPILALSQGIEEVSVWALKAGMGRQRRPDVSGKDT